MADPFSGLPPELAAQLEAIRRRQELSKLLTAKSLQPIEAPQSKGRFQAPVSPFQGLAQLAQAYVGKSEAEGAKQDFSGLGQKYQGLIDAEMEKYRTTAEGTPGTPTFEGMTGSLDEQDMPMAGQVKGNPRAAIEAAMLSQLAPVRQFGALQEQRQARKEELAENRAARLHEKVLTLEAAAQNAALSREERAARAKEAADLRRELAENQAATRRELQGNMQTFQAEQRELDRFARFDLATRTIEQRKRDKLDAATGKTDEAKMRVTGNLKALEEYYDELSNLGGITDSKNNSIQNAWARIRATKGGQLIGEFIGSKEQDWRGKINAMRPLLMNEIRQASAMGARGLDSNKELEFYIQAATDPTKSIQVNKAAMQVLENAYGLSSKISGVDPSTVSELKAEWDKTKGPTSPNAAPAVTAPTTAPSSRGWSVVR